jgi:glycosyltransferase involved in cell wall biosynthesis
MAPGVDFVNSEARTHAEVDVSVIIPTVNSTLLPITLDSLREQQTTFQYEILVVGREDSDEIKQRSDIRFIETDEPLSAGANRNIGINAASGRFVLFTDADCKVSPNWIQTITDRMSEGYRMVGGAFTFPKNNYWVTSDNMAILHNLSPETPGGEVDVRVGGGNMGVWRESLEQLGGFDETFRGGQDNDLAIKLLNAGHKIYFEPLATVEHMPEQGSCRWLCRHAMIYGSASVALIERHPDYYEWERRKRVWRFRILLLVWSPFRAAFQAIAVFKNNRSWLRYLHVVPGIWLFYFLRRVAIALNVKKLLDQDPKVPLANSTTPSGSI